MKKFHYLSIVVVMLALLLMLTACESQVGSPENFRLNDETQTLYWDKVTGAYGYEVLINGEPKSTRTNSYSLEQLEPGVYTIQVKALGDGDEFKDSPYMSYEYRRDKETGLTYKLINNNTAYELTGVGTAEGDVVMETYYRNKPVVSIAPKALANNELITSFTFNELVTAIPDRMFNNCRELVSVSIPENITFMGEGVFQSCHKLVNVEFPDSLQAIGNYAFSYCGGLTTVKLGSQTKRIGDFAFSDCKVLTQVEIPDTLESIGTYAFSNCEALEAVHLGGALQEIGEYAFYSCKTLDTLAFGNNLTTLGNSAFEYCEGITEVTIPNSVITIGDRVFANCTQLAAIHLDAGNHLESIGQEFILNTAYLEAAPVDQLVYVGNWLIVSKDPEISNGRDLDSFIKDGTVGIANSALANCKLFTGVHLKDVKYIGKNSFANCEKLMDLRLGQSALVIDNSAFAGCKLLTNLFISTSSLKRIGANAFMGCERLKSVDLPDTIESIGASAFMNSGLPFSLGGVYYADNWAVGVVSNGVNNITIKEGTIGIADYTFNRCELIGSVTFPDSLRTIGRGAFHGCKKISITKFNEGLVSIGDYAFYGCQESNFGESMHLVLPSTLERIGRSAFYQTLVTGLEIPGSCKFIDDYAFFNCPALGTMVITGVDPSGMLTTEKRELILHEGIEYIGNRVFASCYGLENVTIPNSVTFLGERVFYQCTALQSVTIGSGVTAIGDYSFYECEALTSVVLSNNITSIGNYAFRSCKQLKDIQLGSKVERIGNYAFTGCEMLPALRLPATLTEIGWYAFYGVKSLGALTVPAGVANVGEHAMYGAGNLTMYAEQLQGQQQWHRYWNSSYRPVIWGCTLSADKTYLVSFTKNSETMENTDALAGITAPYRVGYDFLGWAVTEGGAVEYGMAELMQVPDGTTLYAVWGIIAE